ncbi:hypothetical protein BDF19DRAFT_414791 [Syncephalis fuscata]|nr:hypothetical protein BDF19DRAFT_414791 [Syncephalis fuscata]
MADQNSLIANFVAATEATTATAEFYLQANNWDLALAVNSYFAQGPPPIEASSIAASSSHDSEAAVPTTSHSGTGKGSSSSSTFRQTKITTLQDILKRNETEGADDEEEGEKYYAGGEKSGTMMQGAAKPTNDDNSKSLINRILKKAAEQQPMPPPSELEQGSNSTAQPSSSSSSFTGRAYRVGEEVPVSLDEPVTTIKSHEQDTGNDEDSSNTVVRHLTFWSDGFTIDDGPLESYDDPANKAFLTAINNGHAPLDRLNVKRGQPVELAVERRLSEKYTPPPPPPAKPFSGAAHRLGSPTPSMSNASTATQASSSSSSTPASTLPPQNMVGVDESEPVTTLQIRLADGTRLVSKFNHTHTIGDIRRFINAARIDNRNYILQTTFPPKSLTDDSISIKDAGLLNAVVVQRFV